ncbi:hypothetical protein KSC_008450 [Ktedonobacter sp. SOSP1-52]|uniref:DUF6220 domain-containing protein n=1 Tax=Ktedonobacter sp. SOSP1-52 TaxID=2778366 RepID=UPI001914E5AA|nr:DUF6220 domain-containing protein [Ktedonobacter sp. SOSP1-52]GHO61953.1 hypothetical protein KSC_008450 [Ktedonobacter sp. SOSP1-52]
MQVSRKKMPMAHSRMLLFYLTLAGLILLGILIEGFLIGTSIFAGTAWGRATHGALGLLLLLLTLLLPLAALLARLPGTMTIWSAVLFVLTLLQVTLAGFARSVPFLAALHPSNAMLLFGLNVILIVQGWQMRGKKSPEMEQAQTAKALPDDGGARHQVPLEIKLATGGYLLYTLISVGVLTLFLLNRNDVVNAVKALNPDFSQSEIDGSVFSIQVIVVGAHLFFGTCTACLAFLIRTGKNWVRIASSVVAGLVVLEICYEWLSPTDVPAVLAPNQRIYAVFVQILMILMILSCVTLQWVPQASRDFFSAEKRQVS